MHEVIHVLGGILTGNHFRRSDGTTYPNLYSAGKATGAVYTTGYPGELANENRVASEAHSDGWVGTTKAAKLVKTPTVLEIAKEQFACPDLAGIPLEDQVVGANAHWEARVMGPEVM